MKTLHTPGPWTAHNFGDDSWEILTATTIVAEVQDNLSSPGNSEANAILIAASPLMLEALQAVVLAVANNPIGGPWEQVASAIAAATDIGEITDGPDRDSDRIIWQQIS